MLLSKAGQRTNSIRTIFREIFELFVDDVSFALLILAWPDWSSFSIPWVGAQMERCHLIRRTRRNPHVERNSICPRKRQLELHIVPSGRTTNSLKVPGSAVGWLGGWGFCGVGAGGGPSFAAERKTKCVLSSRAIWTRALFGRHILHNPIMISAEILNDG